MATASHNSTPGRQSILGNDSQGSLRILAEMPPPESVADDLIDRLGSLSEAVHLCIYLSRFSNERIARELGIDPGHWTRMMQGRAHFPLNKITALEDLCGNLAPTQYLMAMRKLRMPRANTYRQAEAA